ncbi:TetR/AcrR family transcriptional regulator [Saccharomonospora iraqiensis]|uniref:TetR/AcrR family transcriptional regulator n=1 Tax=Saccharomonospora iraqiensis TaxID=52698 RepID=UPI00022E5A4A|nr:TetR/AcrR family transcriptional regulator [Saccharomonospora iraqiensis]
MSERSTRERTRDNTRVDRKWQIATIAAELFCRRGYYTVGLTEIAAEAGITGPAVYKHFPSKQAILAHVAEEVSGRLDELVTTARSATGTPREQLDALIRGCARLVVERRGSVALYQRESRYLGPAEHARFTGAIEAVLGVVADRLAATRPELSGKDALIVASAACSAIVSLGVHRIPVSDRTARDGLREIADRVLATELPSASAEGPSVGEAARGEFLSRRERLLVAAPRPLRERGFHGVTMEDLGAAAGIGGSSVYRHFRGKADLLAAVYYRATDRLAVTTGEAIGGAADACEALRALTESYVDFALRHSDLAAVYLTESENLPDDDRHALRRAQRDHVDQWVRLVTARRGGPRSTRVRLAVHAALNIVHDQAMSRERVASPDQVAALAAAALPS